MPAEMLFIHKDLPETDKDLFFGPLDVSEKIEVFDDGAILAHIMADAGKFPSISQARKNGWDNPVPAGLSHFTVGKNQNRTDIWVLNKFEGWEN